MFIVHVFHHYYPFVGGMETVVKGLAEAQVSLGHEVTVLTSTFGAQDKPSKEILNGVHIQRINAWRFHYSYLTIPKGIPAELLTKTDIVHVHSQNCFFSLNLLSMTSKLKIKTACYFMAVNALQNHPNSLIRFLGPVYDRRNVNKALAMTNLALVKSKRDLTVLKNSYNFDATYLPDAISDSFSLLSKDLSDDFRKRFGIKQAHFFLFIGRLHKLKGPQILVKALKYVGDEIAAVFIGPDDGYMKETLRLAEHLHVQDKIYVLGYLDEATKVQAIDSSVALVNPSISDNVEVYSIVISEAWAREKPVIATRVGEIPFRVEHGVNGLLVEPSNYKMLAEAMRDLCRNNKLSEALGKEGKRTVFSWTQVASRSIELYQQVLNS